MPRDYRLGWNTKSWVRCQSSQMQAQRWIPKKNDMPWKAEKVKALIYVVQRYKNNPRPRVFFRQAQLWGSVLPCTRERSTKLGIWGQALRGPFCQLSSAKSLVQLMALCLKVEEITKRRETSLWVTSFLFRETENQRIIPQGTPLTDGNKVKNILCKMTGSNERAFLNQTAPLNKTKMLVEEDDERQKKASRITPRAQWVLPAKRPLDLIVVNLPRKFAVSRIMNIYETYLLTFGLKTPPLGASTSTLDVLTETKRVSPVYVGQFFEPAFLPNFSTETCQLVKDKLVQHNIRDINNELISAWKIEEGLRPGTVVLISAVLHVYNIKNERGRGFRRVCWSSDWLLREKKLNPVVGIAACLPSFYHSTEIPITHGRVFIVDDTLTRHRSVW